MCIKQLLCQPQKRASAQHFGALASISTNTLISLPSIQACAADFRGLAILMRFPATADVSLFKL
jgi:hypothetical protein